MKPTLEPAGPLLVPVDDSGTATGRPIDGACEEGAACCAFCGADHREAPPSAELTLRHTLRRLYVEALFYRDTGRGREHLTNALIDARRVLDGGAL